jgi:hypothetical protein
VISVATREDAAPAQPAHERRERRGQDQRDHERDRHDGQLADAPDDPRGEGDDHDDLHRADREGAEGIRPEAPRSYRAHVDPVRAVLVDADGAVAEQSHASTVDDRSPPLRSPGRTRPLPLGEHACHGEADREGDDDEHRGRRILDRRGVAADDTAIERYAAAPGTMMRTAGTVRVTRAARSRSPR